MLLMTWQGNLSTINNDDTLISRHQLQIMSHETSSRLSMLFHERYLPHSPMILSKQMMQNGKETYKIKSLKWIIWKLRSHVKQKSSKPRVIFNKSKTLQPRFIKVFLINIQIDLVLSTQQSELLIYCFG
ncbi:hypothetical protein FGO68_gene13493 [Halteria grandinella]|uniref:Uncharacterized protein n=1 Tax=Halteria grandinella TaxID=5974 RepID=A0A8J8NHU9_HALGN|nr:hypothetical protein FGO68_gene13493 [Halteria grandinella]